MQKFQCLFFVFKRSYTYCYITCITVPLMMLDDVVYIKIIGFNDVDVVCIILISPSKRLPTQSQQ